MFSVNVRPYLEPKKQPSSRSLLILEDVHIRGLPSLVLRRKLGLQLVDLRALCTQSCLKIFLISGLPWGLTQGFRKYWLNKAGWLKECIFSCTKQIAMSLVSSTDLREDRTVVWFLGGEDDEWSAKPRCPLFILILPMAGCPEWPDHVSPSDTSVDGCPQFTVIPGFPLVPWDGFVLIPSDYEKRY